LKNSADIIALCIDDIKAGRATLEECLAKYPAISKELESLLEIALSIEEPPDFKPTDDFKIRTRVQLIKQIHNEQNKEKTPGNIFYSGSKRSWYPQKLRAVSPIIAIILAVLASGIGATYAIEDSLPGDNLYTAKIAAEQVARSLTFNDLNQIELELAFAKTRLDETKTLADENPERIALAVEGYENNMKIAIEKVANCKEGSIYATGLEMVALSTLQHIDTVDNINDNTIAGENEALQQANILAFRAHFQVLGLLAEEDPFRATVINMETIQNRLTKAHVKADIGDITGAENALKQFEEAYKFGEEISEIAKRFGHSTTANDLFSIQVMATYRNMIQNMRGKISDEAIDSVEEVIGTSIENNNEEEQEETPGKDTDNDSDQSGNSPEEAGETPNGSDDAPKGPDNSPGPGNGSS
jgi:hypothetical protein